MPEAENNLYAPPVADFAPVGDVRPEASFARARMAGLFDWAAFTGSFLGQILIRHDFPSDHDGRKALFFGSFLVPPLLISYFGRSLGGLLTGTRIERTNGRRAGLLRAGLPRVLLPAFATFVLSFELDKRYGLHELMRQITPPLHGIAGAIQTDLYALIVAGTPYVLYGLCMSPNVRRRIDLLTGTRVVDLRRPPSIPAA